MANILHYQHSLNSLINLINGIALTIHLSLYPHIDSDESIPIYLIVFKLLKHTGIISSSLELIIPSAIHYLANKATLETEQFTHPIGIPVFETHIHLHMKATVATHPCKLRVRADAATDEVHSCTRTHIPSPSKTKLNGG